MTGQLWADLPGGWVMVGGGGGGGIPATIIDAKGDLIAGSAADTPARVAVGTDGQVLSADAASAAGVKWITLAGGGNVTAGGALTANQVIIGAGGTGVAALGSLGTATTVLHGNAAGAPTFGAVSLTADVSGDLPFSSLAQITGPAVLGVTGAGAADVAAISSSADGQVLRRAGGAVGFGAVDLADTDAVTGDLPLSNIVPSGSASRLLGRTDASAGDWQEITVGSGLSISGTTLSATGSGAPTDAEYIVAALHAGLSAERVATNSSTISWSFAVGGQASASIIGNAVGDMQLRQGAATSVIGRSAGTTGNVADIAASANGQVLRRSGGSLAFGAVDLADGTNAVTGDLAYANLTPSSAASKLLGRGDSGAGDWQEITLGTGLAMTGTTLSSSGGSGIPVTIIDAKGDLIAGSAADTAVRVAVGTDGQVLSADAASTGGVKWITLAGGGNVTAGGTLTSNQIVLGAGGTAVATLGSLGTTTTVLHGNAGGAPTFGAVDLTADVSGDLPFANLTQGSALSVLGVTGNATADVASIAAGSDGQVLRRSGTSLAFGAVDLASANAVTGDLPFSAIAQITTDRLLGRDTAGTGDIEQLTVGGGIEFTGSVGIQRSALTGDVTASAGSGSTTIANDAVTFAKMQNIATDRLIGRDTAATGDPEELTVGGGLEFSGAGGIQRSALTGDVTASAASNATTIANDAVTYAKMQNVSAASKLLGRGDSGSGDPQEITLGTGLTMTGTTLAASGGGGGATVVVKQTDQTVNNSATLVDDTALKFTMATNTKYWFRLIVFFNTGATPDFKWRITGPASPTTVNVNYRQAVPNAGPTASTNITAYPAADISAVSGASAEGEVEIEGFIENGGTGGDFKFQWAQNAANASNTFVRGSSYLQYQAV